MKFQKATGCFLILLMVCFLGSWNVAAQTRPPMPEAEAALESDAAVTVKEVEMPEWGETENYYYVFEPNKRASNVGFIFYPGAMVDPKGYAPPARALAEKGYFSFIVKMPGNIAFNGGNRANEIIDAYSGIDKWIIGGHSLGGVTASGYVANFRDKIDGLVLWGTYLVDSVRIDDLDLPVISIYGTNDGVSDLGEIEASIAFLPADTQYVEIKGGNHTQFGWYYENDMGEELQEGDLPATITREEQQKIIIDSTADFLGQFKETDCPAAYLLGAEDPRLDTIREFRDEVMVKSKIGKKLIETFDTNRDYFIAAFDGSPALRLLAQKSLTAIVPLMELF